MSINLRLHQSVDLFLIEDRASSQEYCIPCLCYIFKLIEAYSNQQYL